MTTPDRPKGKPGPKRVLTPGEQSLAGIFLARISQLSCQQEELEGSEEARRKHAPWAMQEIGEKLNGVRGELSRWARGLNDPNHSQKP